MVDSPRARRKAYERAIELSLPPPSLFPGAVLPPPSRSSLSLPSLSLPPARHSPLSHSAYPPYRSPRQASVPRKFPAPSSSLSGRRADLLRPVNVNMRSSLSPSCSSHSACSPSRSPALQLYNQAVTTVL